MQGKDYILVALDMPDPPAAIAMARKLRGHVAGFKIGSVLFTIDGPAIVRQIDGSFLDLKYHDISNTVAGSVLAAAQIGAKMINVHAVGGSVMMKAAKASLDCFLKDYGFRPRLIAVTVLTSMNGEGLCEVGYSAQMEPRELVRRLARLALFSGLDGVVCSPQEIQIVRNACGSGFYIVTPGIRSSDDDKGDQKRTLSAAEAVTLGANQLVIGRPITEAADPIAAADKIAAEIDAVLLERRS